MLRTVKYRRYKLEITVNACVTCSGATGIDAKGGNLIKQ